MGADRWFPVTLPTTSKQAERSGPSPTRIPWSTAEKAYSVYAGRYGRGQSIERIAERGGFYAEELDDLFPGWREEASEIAELRQQLAALHAAIRKHRDQRGDDRCWMDDEQLYEALPEGYTPPARDSAVELERCRQFIASRWHPATAYVSPQRRIEELEAEVDQYKRFVTEMAATGNSNPLGSDGVPEA